MANLFALKNYSLTIISYVLFIGNTWLTEQLSVSIMLKHAQGVRHNVLIKTLQNVFRKVLMVYSELHIELDKFGSSETFHLKVYYTLQYHINCSPPTLQQSFSHKMFPITETTHLYSVLN